MGKKNTSSLGNGILKERTKSSKNSKVNDSWLHTSELNDGYDWNRINLRSVTEQSNLEDFLETAELAGTEFTAERLNVRVIDPSQHTGLPSKEENLAITKAQRENLDFLNIPRRPEWDSTTTAEELNQREKATFLEWRRQLSLLQEKEHIVLTPFERNLDFWRQLWRVIERSDIIVQIVDARNPLLFRCEDLEKYVKEVNEAKENVILISKADLLTQAQREQWAEYFSQQGIRVAFWSATREMERIDQEEAANKELEAENFEDEEVDDEDDDDDEEEEEEEVIDDEREDIVDESTSAAHSLASEECVANNMEGLSIGSDGDQGPPGLGTNATDNRDQEPVSPSPGTCPSDNRLAETEGGDDTPCRACGDANQMPSAGSTRNDDSMNANSEDVEEKSRSDDVSPDSAHAAEGDISTRTMGQESSPDGPVSQAHKEALCTPSPKVSFSLPTNGNQSQVDDEDTQDAPSCQIRNASHLFTGEELLSFLKEIHVGRSKVDQDVLTVGMVGYPNVGKSSTINAILREKKVPVSATPGRTKHFQTLFMEPTLCLCDCPGLVMPSFVSTKADMYLNGILPIDQMRDFTGPVSLMVQRMPREVLELTYGINLIKPGEGEDQTRPPTVLEFLNAHAYVRGFMTQKGVPDCFRSARIILKDYVVGKVLYCVPPPGMTPEEFDSIHFPSDEVGEVKAGMRPKKSANKPMITEGGQTVKISASKKVDESFFAKPPTAHFKVNAPSMVGVAGHGVGMVGKPWKKQKRAKKGKLRKIYGHLDEK